MSFCKREAFYRVPPGVSLMHAVRSALLHTYYIPEDPSVGQNGTTRPCRHRKLAYEVVFSYRKHLLQQ